MTDSVNGKVLQACVQCSATQTTGFNQSVSCFLLYEQVISSHSLEYHTRVYITRDYGMTLFHDRRAKANMEFIALFVGPKIKFVAKTTPL